MTFILILLACIIGYFLIKYWIKLINFIFKPIEKALENKQEKIKTRQTEIEKDKNGVSNVNLGEFDLNDFPEQDKSKSFYFFEYNKPDGEWIEIDEPPASASVPLVTSTNKKIKKK